MKTRLVIIALISLVWCAMHGTIAHAQATDPLTLFKQANDLYQKGKFEQSAVMYESLINEKQVNAAVWYNLGNAYYRNQKPGMALVAYERAHRLAPRDADIRYNANFIRQQAGEPEQGFADYLLSLPANSVSLNETAIAFTVSLFVFSLFGSLWLFRRYPLTLPATVAAGLCIIFAGSLLALKAHDEVFTHHAVVTTGPVEVRNGPDVNETVGFSLPEGRSVIILGEQGDWTAIGVKAEGYRGWLPTKNIQQI